MRNHTNVLSAFLLAAAIALAVPLEGDRDSMTTDFAKRQPPGKFQDVALQVLLFGAVTTWLRFTWDCIAGEFVRQTRGAGHAGNGIAGGIGNGVTHYELALHPDGEGEVPRGVFGNTIPIPFRLGGQTVGLVFTGVTQDDDSIVLVIGNWTWPTMIYPGYPLNALNINTNQWSVVTFPRIVIGEPRAADRNDPPAAEGEGYNSDADSSTNFGAE